MKLIRDTINSGLVWASREVSSGVYPGGHRYWLSGDTCSFSYEHEWLIWLMLNPSTAKAGQHDATSRKVLGFTIRLGARRWGIVNMFAKRATNPKDLFADGYEAAVGKYNNAMLEKTFDHFSGRATFIAAWGSVSVAAKDKRHIQQRVAAVMDMAIQYSVELKALGVASDGNPRHPLMLPYLSTPLHYGLA